MWNSDSKPRRFALKLQLKQGATRQAFSEVLALRRADHPFIVRLERAFQTPKFFALLLELCPTDLNRVLCEENEEFKCPGIDSKRCAKYMGQILLALVHLHTQEQPIVYRDIKPENILISFEDEAKLTDFGLAKIITEKEKMTMCGTAGFFPPELLSDSDDSDEQEGRPRTRSSSSRTPAHQRKFKDPFKMDAYSFGVTLQVTLLGTEGARKVDIRKKGAMMLPFNLSEEENTELLDKCMSDGKLSEDGYDLLVNKLLPMEPDERFELKWLEILNHDFWLKELGCTDLKAHLIPEVTFVTAMMTAPLSKAAEASNEITHQASQHFNKLGLTAQRSKSVTS